MEEQQGAPLVVISNRGPVDFVWQDRGWQPRPAAGGLSSMLRPLARDLGLVWACCVAEPAEARPARAGLDRAARAAMDGLPILPVPIDAEVYEGYYSRVSNEILWMLQHLVIGPGGLDCIDGDRSRAWDEGYLAANRRIADTVCAAIPHARAILVQDYHLYPLPAMLRRRLSGVPILHFTHIPFVGPSVWRLLPAPWREAVLRGLLGADVVGLQTPRDVRTFLASCDELQGLPVELRASGDTAEGTVGLEGGRRVLVRAYPASVDPDWLAATMRSDAAQAARERLAAHADRRLVVRVDRLDPAKNQVVGFRAFGRLLEDRPDLRAGVRFVAQLVPSRQGLPAYRAHREAVMRVVEEVNGRFAEACGGPPIVLELENNQVLGLALLERADVLLVNSLGDGMNLIVKEWATVARRDGVAVVSETTGAALGSDGAALLVAPLDVEGTARALAAALDMPAGERAARLGRLRERVRAWTSRDWLAAQLADLERRAERDGRPAEVPVWASLFRPATRTADEPAGVATTGSAGDARRLDPC